MAALTAGGTLTRAPGRRSTGAHPPHPARSPDSQHLPPYPGPDHDRGMRGGRHVAYGPGTARRARSRLDHHHAAPRRADDRRHIPNPDHGAPATWWSDHTTSTLKARAPGESPLGGTGLLAFQGPPKPPSRAQASDIERGSSRAGWPSTAGVAGGIDGSGAHWSKRCPSTARRRLPPGTRAGGSNAVPSGRSSARRDSTAFQTGRSDASRAPASMVRPAGGAARRCAFSPSKEFV